MFTSNDNEPSLRELERDAERNRANLMETVATLQERISPEAIKHDVQDYVRSRKDSFLESLEQTVRDNPVQTIAIAAGAAYPLWSFVSRIPVPLLLIGAGFILTRRSPDSRKEDDGSSFAGGARERLGRASDAARRRLGEASEAMRDRVEDGMETARRAADRVTEYGTQALKNAEGIAADIGERALESTEALRGMSSNSVSKAGEMLSPIRMKRAGTLASDWLDNTITANPLLVGSVGLAIGAIIAAALPSTEQEDQLLGRTADDVKSRARQAALEGVETAKTVAKELYRDAADHAKEEGLSVDDAREFAGQIGEKVRTVVANVSGDKKQGNDLDEDSPHKMSGGAG